MVNNKDKKKDVFAGFGLDTTIRDNGDQLNRREEEEICGSASSEYVDDSVFAEFKLDEKARRHKGRMRKDEAENKKKTAKEEAEGASESLRGGASSSLRGLSLSLRGEVTSSLRGLGGLLSSSLRGEGTSSLRGVGGLFLRSPPPPASPQASSIQRTLSKGSDDNHRRHLSRRENGERDNNIAMRDEEESTGVKRHHSQSKKKHKNSSRSGTTITASIPEEDEEYDVDENEEVASLGDGESDVEEEENSDDDDDDSYIGPDKRRKSSVITRSSTGMPIGGMVTNSTTGDSSSSTLNSDYHWISPHSADTIFSGFDIDAIVKDYEKLHRRINFGTDMGGKNNSGLDDIEEEGNNEQSLGISVRYRNLLNLWLDNFPRTHCILFQIMLPLSVIVLLTMYLGNVLAKFEKPVEIADNDAIMRNSYDLNSYDLNGNSHEETLRTMFELPTICFDYYLDKKNSNISNIINTDIISNIGITTSANETGEETNSIIDLDSISLLSKLAGQDFPNVSLGFDSDLDVTIDEIESYMKICKDAGTEILEKFIDFTAKELEAASQDTMTFNWIRCWNTTELDDVNPYFPTKDQLKAASSQEDFYFRSWKLNQTMLYEQYMLESNCTNVLLPCQQEAYNRSVEEATGSTMCDINLGASAWFWFVVMTTVGYGNVSPVSMNGRILVIVFGWITIIVWAILLFIAGRVLGIVIDDLFRRYNCRVMTRNLPSVIVWGSVAMLWIVFVGEHYLHWNNYTDDPDNKSNRFRLTPFENGGNESDGELTTFEAYWFAYISLLTVGKEHYTCEIQNYIFCDNAMHQARDTHELFCHCVFCEILLLHPTNDVCIY